METRSILRCAASGTVVQLLRALHASARWEFHERVLKAHIPPCARLIFIRLCRGQHVQIEVVATDRARVVAEFRHVWVLHRFCQKFSRPMLIPCFRKVPALLESSQSAR